MASISLLEVLALLPDPRQASGRRHPILPCKATFHKVCKALGVERFEQGLGRWLAGRCASGWRKLSIDSKTLCGATGQQLPGVHLLVVYAHEAQAALMQLRVDAKIDEHKAALKLLGVLDLAGKVVVGDAAFCQPDLSRKVLKKRGLPLAGQGQPAQAQGGNPAPDRPADAGMKNGQAPLGPHAQDYWKGHGRIEGRLLLALQPDPQALGWPGAAQVILLRRERIVGEKSAVALRRPLRRGAGATKRPERLRIKRPWVRSAVSAAGFGQYGNI
ncbi:MAG: transposase [Phycisphaeraceae bacterium]